MVPIMLLSYSVTTHPVFLMALREVRVLGHTGRSSSVYCSTAPVQADLPLAEWAPTQLQGAEGPVGPGDLICSPSLCTEVLVTFCHPCEQTPNRELFSIYLQQPAMWEMERNSGWQLEAGGLSRVDKGSQVCHD